jgi:hypothetical protein
MKHCKVSKSGSSTMPIALSCEGIPCEGSGRTREPAVNNRGMMNGCRSNALLGRCPQLRERLANDESPCAEKCALSDHKILTGGVVPHGREPGMSASRHALLADLPSVGPEFISVWNRRRLGGRHRFLARTALPSSDS